MLWLGRLRTTRRAVLSALLHQYEAVISAYRYLITVSTKIFIREFLFLLMFVNPAFLY